MLNNIIMKSFPKKNNKIVNTVTDFSCKFSNQPKQG